MNRDVSKLELNSSLGLGLTFLNGHEEHFNSIVSTVRLSLDCLF